jgi:hypothetical protein
MKVKVLEQRSTAAVDGAEQGRRDALDLGIIGIGNAVGDQARRSPRCRAGSWLILVTAMPSAASLLFLVQSSAQARLHVNQLAFGDSQSHRCAGLAPEPNARHLRVVAERGHALRDAPHRPHHQPLQAEIDQRRGDQRDDDRQLEDALGVVEHRDAQRLLVDGVLRPRW